MKQWVFWVAFFFLLLKTDELIITIIHIITKFNNIELNNVKFECWNV